MVSSRPRPASLVIVSIAVLVVVGAIAVPGGATSGETVQVDKAGTPVDIVPGEPTQTVTEIDVSGDGSFSDDRVRVYINLSTLQDQKIDVSSVSVADIEISGGTVLETTSYVNSDDERVVGIEIEDSDSNGDVMIEQLMLESLDTEDAYVDTELTHQVQATERTDADLDDPDLDSGGAESEPFSVADSSMVFNNQSTMSTTAVESGFTGASLVIENAQANTDSVLVATYEHDGDTEISGMVAASAEELDGSHEALIEAEGRTGFPGEFTVYVFPTTRFDTDKYEPTDSIPEEKLQSSTASETSSLTMGLLDMESKDFDEVVDEYLLLESADFYDGDDDDDTPFVINLHPTDEDGFPETDEYLGSSDVLEGENSDVPIHLEDSHGDDIELKRTGEYAVTLRVTDENQSAGDPAAPGDYQLQPNSDSESGFVFAGVADSAKLTFDVELPPPNVDRVFSENQSLEDTRVFSGQSIALQVEMDGAQYDLIRHDGNGTETVASESEVDGYVEFHTDGLHEGEYSIEGSEFSSGIFNLTHQEMDTYIEDELIAVDDPEAEQQISIQSSDRDDYVVTASIENASGNHLASDNLESVFNQTNEWDNVTDADSRYLSDSGELNRSAIYDDRDKDDQFLIHDRKIYFFGGDNEYDIDLSVLETGDYKLDIGASDTEVQSTESAEVLPREAVIPDDVKSIYQSDHLTVPLSATSVTETGQVRIESDTGNSTTIDVAFDDTSETTLRVNTYAAGTDTGPVVTADGATAELVDADTLPPGEYTVSTRADPDRTEPDDNATIALADRPPRNATLLAGTDVTADDLATTEAVRDAIADDRLEPTDEVGPNDTLVYAVDAPGLDGLVDAHTSHDRLAALSHLPALSTTPGLEPTIRERDADDPLVADLEADSLDERSHVLHAPTGLDPTDPEETDSDETDSDDLDADSTTSDGDPAVPTALVVLDADAIEFEDGDWPPADGTTFDARLRVTDDRLHDDADDHGVTMTYVDPDAAEEDGDDGDDTSDGGSGGGSGGASGGGTGGGGTGGGGAGGSGSGGGGGTESADESGSDDGSADGGTDADTEPNASLPSTLADAVPDLHPTFVPGAADPSLGDADSDGFDPDDAVPQESEPNDERLDVPAASDGDAGPSLSDFTPEDGGTPETILEAIYSGEVGLEDVRRAAGHTATDAVDSGREVVDAASTTDPLDHDLPSAVGSGTIPDLLPRSGTTTDRVPGFGATGALLALLALGGWALRRRR